MTALAAVLASFVAVVGMPTAASADAGSNPIVTENAQPGTEGWRITETPSDDVHQQIKGFASATSVDIGSPIKFYVTVSPKQKYSIDIYRMGYYQGLGGRLMRHVGGLDGLAQPACVSSTTTGMTSCDNWSQSYLLDVPTTWTSGIYLAKLTNANDFQNYIVFTVRDDARPADLLYQQSVTTYQAYNNYPNDVPDGGTRPATGKSLYDYNSSSTPTDVGTSRATSVSFDRPYSNDDGAGDFLDWELYQVRWLEESGYDVTYSTDVDTHAHPERLLQHHAFLSVGHDEYWSKGMRDGVEAARAGGVNLAFLGANAAYWQVRFDSSASGGANRVMVCYKSAVLDPVSDPTVTTVKWRDNPVNRPEQTLIGVMSTGQQPNGDPPAPHVVRNASSWVYDGTGLNNGDAVPGIVGYETDRVVSGSPSPVTVPGSYTVLSNSPYATGPGTSDFANATVYKSPSGAWVFAAASIEWAWGLTNYGARQYADPRIQRMTANVLDRFAVGGTVPAPAAPTAVTATPTSASAVTLAWHDDATNETTYVIDRSTTATFDQVTTTTLPADSTGYNDTGLNPGVYYYRVRAANPTDNSSYSATAGVATTSYQELVQNRPGLIARWRLGEANGTAAIDSAGTATGTYQNGTTLGATGAIARDPDTAASFNGTNNKVSLPTLPTTTDFTIEGWTNLTNAASTNNTLYGSNGTVRLLPRPGGQNTTTIAYAGLWLDGTEYTLQPNTNNQNNLNTWVHWALTRAGNTLTLYRNGIQIGQRTDLPATTPANINGWIAAQTGNAFYLQGRIDDVAIYNRALTASTISDNYTAATNGLTPAPPAVPSYRSAVLSEAGLQSYWRLGEASGTTAADAKGTSNGTYTNGVSLGAPGAIANDPNSAASFNGTNNKVSLPAVPPVSDFSIEGWSYLTNATSNNNALYGTSTTARILVRPGGSATSTLAYAGVWLNGTEYTLQPSSGAVSNLNTWVHWALTRSGATLRLYRNGVQVAQRTDLPPAAQADISGWIGAQGGNAYYLTGRVDDIAVYNTALTPTRVAAHYDAALNGPAPQ